MKKVIEVEQKVRNPFAVIKKTGSGLHTPKKGKGSYKRKPFKMED
jgi:hypothetical protein